MGELPKGPRIIFKDDRDSGVGRGCVLYAGHLREEVIGMIRVAAQVAPDLIDNTMVVSEGYRSIRPTRDLHEELRAFDISFNQIQGDYEVRRKVGIEWSDRIRRRLGFGYDLKVHGVGTNLHLHIELDP